MSKITSDGLTRSGTGCFIAVPQYPYGNSERQRVNELMDHFTYIDQYNCTNVSLIYVEKY